MARIKFTRIENSEQINDVDFVDGQLIACGDGKLFLDYNEKRVNCGGINLEEMMNEVNKKNIMDIEGTNNRLAINIPEAWKFHKVQLDKLANKMGDKLIYENGDIVIGPGVSKVKVSGTIMLSFNGNSAELYGGIALNEEQVTNTYIYYTSSFETISHSPKIIDVKEGDVISLTVGSNKAGTITVVSTSSYLEVEVVE